MTLRLVLSALFIALAASAGAQEPQPSLSGDIRIHDPSIIEVDGRYAAFFTGQQGASRGAIRVKTSVDGISWADAGSVGKGLPKWVRKALGFQPPEIWAPSVSRHGDVFNLYYSVSVFGINTSAIGLTTNGAFDPEQPGEGWEDHGLVLQSTIRDDWNAIDPWRIDTSDGRAWLAYGSFWSGIKMRELDPETGKLIAEDTPTFDLASRDGAGIEAASILERDGRFYLFVSFDQCCKGLQSTYNIRVGRADAVAGPYVDKDGKPMLQGGGTMLLGSTGRFIGPGGQEAFVSSKGEMLAFHYYDGADHGASKLQISPLNWTADGWPELPALPE
ncbi:MAG TPA: arabinan endo-1,5-alpha-L-arabinosidase [Devosia sp.]